MKITAFCAAILFAFSTPLFAAEISFNANDPHSHVGAHIDARDARLAIMTSDRSMALVLTNQVVAMQLSDRTIEQIKSDDHDSFFAEMLVSGIRTMLNKSISFPIAYVRSAELVDGVLVLTGADGQPLFSNVSVDGENAMRSFAFGDAARFVNAFRAVKRASKN